MQSPIVYPTEAPTAPSDHPTRYEWPPKPPAYETGHPAWTDSQFASPFNEQQAIDAFGLPYVRRLTSAHSPRFKGDWWMLALLTRCEETVAKIDPEGSDADRMHWWNSVWSYARLAGLRLYLDGALLRDRRLQHADLSEAKLRHSDLTGARLDLADLSLAMLSAATLTDARLPGANMQAAQCYESQLERANLRNADLTLCDLRDVRLSLARLDRANLSRAEIGGVWIDGCSLVRTRGLFGHNRAIARPNPIQEHAAQNAIYRWCFSAPSSWSPRLRQVAESVARDHVSWDPVLRVIGALRLFAVSYVTIIAIVLYAALAQWYNPIAAHTRAAADGTQRVPSSIWDAVLHRVPDLPTPDHLARQLVATVLLALAATIYSVFCPSEVKEATEVRWTRAMGQPLWEYRAANWCRPVWRYACLVLFSLGGAYSLYYLGDRAIDAAVYLFARSTAMPSASPTPGPVG